MPGSSCLIPLRPRPRPVIHILLWGVLLATPAGARAQDGEETSVWQFGIRDVDWEAVERLQEEIRDYRAAGAIGAFEIRIRTNETRLDAMVTAEIVDALKLARLRGLERPEPGAPEPVQGPLRTGNPARLLSRFDPTLPLDALPGDI